MRALRPPLADELGKRTGPRPTGSWAKAEMIASAFMVGTWPHKERMAGRMQGPIFSGAELQKMRPEDKEVAEGLSAALSTLVRGAVVRPSWD